MTNNTKTDKSELGGKKVTDYWEIVVKTSILTQKILVCYICDKIISKASKTFDTEYSLYIFTSSRK